MAELRWLEGTEDEGWMPFARLLSSYWREIIPTERPTLVDDLQAEVAHAPAHRSVASTVAMRNGIPVGASQVVVDALRGDSAWLRFVYVPSEYRRTGVGSQLFAAALEHAAHHGRGRLRTMTPIDEAAGRYFAERFGGRSGQIIEQNRCPTIVLDRNALQRWVDRAAERASGYSLVAFDSVCPEEHLDAFAAIIPIMNTAPRSPGTEDVIPSPAEVWENMSAHVRQGNEPWTVCARDDTSGQFVGFSELSFPARRPWESGQGDTGVDPDHRRLGLGRWMKAQNALRLLAQRPAVEYIETRNAGGNEAMLSINRTMGFRPVAVWHEWDFTV